MPQKLQKKGSLITSIPITSFLPGSWKRLHMGLDLCSFLLKRIYPFSWIFRKASNINKGHTDCLWLKAIRATESRTGWGWKGPVGFIWPYPLPKRGHPEQAAPDHVPMAFEYLHGWRLPKLPGQPVPVLGHPRTEKVAPEVQPGSTPEVEFCPSVSFKKKYSWNSLRRVLEGYWKFHWFYLCLIQYRLYI